MSVSLEFVTMVLGMSVHLIIIVAVFVKLESRLTKLETTLDLMLDNLIGANIVERRIKTIK